MSLAKLTDEGLLKSLNARLIQNALCTLAERENWLLIVPRPPPPCPAPSLTHVHRHKTLQWHPLFLSMFIHSHMHYPEASGSSVTVQTGHHPPLLFLLLSFFFVCFICSHSPSSPPPTSSPRCRRAQPSEGSCFSSLSSFHSSFCPSISF